MGGPGQSPEPAVTVPGPACHSRVAQAGPALLSVLVSSPRRLGFSDVLPSTQQG